VSTDISRSSITELIVCRVSLRIELGVNVYFETARSRSKGLKRITSSILLLSLLSLSCLRAIDETNCNDDARRRIVRGDKHKAQKLYATIKGKFPSWDKDFHEEEFTYVGALANGMEVASLVTVGRIDMPSNY
jgi:hypothetical protein